MRQLVPFLCLLGGCGILHSQTPAIFPDPALELAVRTVVGLTDTDPVSGAYLDPLYQENTQSVVTLYPEDAGVQSLEGIWQLPNLDFLDLYNNPVTDLSPLADLPKLRVLNIDHIPAPQPAFLSSLVSLETLSAVGCQISQLPNLSALQQLRRVVLTANPLDSIEPLRALPSLEQIFVNTTLLAGEQDFRMFVDLIELRVNGTAITRLWLPPSLNALFISQTPLEHLPPAPSLQYLSLEDSTLPLPDLSPLYPQLGSLSLDGTPTPSLNILQGLDKLRLLNLSHLQLATLATLPVLPSLQSLNISWNSLTDIAPLLNQPQLNSLNAFYNYLDIRVDSPHSQVRSLLIEQGVDVRDYGQRSGTRTFSSWASRNGFTGGLPSDPSSDPAIPLWEAYALGMDPNQPLRDAPPPAFIQDGELWVTYTQDMAALEVRPTFSASVDLRTWETAQPTNIHILSQNNTIETRAASFPVEVTRYLRVLY